jgi:hypothetical protein
MALRQNASGARWHFWSRAAGVIGLLVLGIGLVAWYAKPDSMGLLDVLKVQGLPQPGLGLELTVVGGVLLLLALAFELPSFISLLVSRRAAFGSNVVVQVLLAVVLLVGINVFSFLHHWRFDLTRDRLFTIDPEIQHQLAGLRGETRIVLYQSHTSLGQQGDKQDNYDAAAERQIIEKVKDLVEQFQELGPRFRVEVLDIQDEDFQDRLAALKKEKSGAPLLAKAIEAAPESSIFFFSKAEEDDPGKVQRLGFHDIYQLDKKASQEADNGKGNLVLRSQGLKPFANRILNIDEKKPRVVVAVIHELLGLDSGREIGMAGAKKMLTARGFEGRDVVLKKWSETAMPEPAVLTFDESKYERLEAEVNESEATIKSLNAELKELRRHLQEWQTRSLADLSKSDLAKMNKITRVDEDLRQDVIGQLAPKVAFGQMLLEQETRDRDAAAGEMKGLNKESLSEKRRISDLRAKFNRMLADADLLILPRMTLLNVMRGDAIANWLHGLDPAQLLAVKDFMKAGKPVLFCLGPANESPNRPPPPGQGPDGLEPMLAELGIQMPPQTILFNVETKSFAEQRGGFLVLGAETEVPPVEFQWEPGAGTLLGRTQGKSEPNPIRISLWLASRSVGKDGAFDLRLRHPRPVYYEGTTKEEKAVDPVFLITSREAWNEKEPFPTRERRVPRFQLPKPGDPDRGTVREERRDQFPIAVALETPLPKTWYDGDNAKPATVRLAVIGQGSVFSGPTLSPAKEKLFLDVSNWLLGRDDLLAHDDPQPWHYPRVSLSDEDNALWQWGTRLGLPVFFIGVGLLVLMVRRMR